MDLRSPRALSKKSKKLKPIVKSRDAKKQQKVGKVM